jgi:glycosyltransferase involved in cell wall biosynthesis
MVWRVKMVLTNESNSFLIEAAVTNVHEPLLVIGIPAYNEEKTIARIILQAQKQADIVVVCDDGSADLTKQIAERMGADVIRHERNSGYGAAIQSLFKRARALNADVLVTLDGDGQHDPDEIQQLIKPIIDGDAEVVLGSRFMDDAGTADMPFYRKIGIKAVTKLVNGSENVVSDAQSGFRAYSKYAIQSLSISENGMSASIELLRAIRKNGLKVSEVPISCKYSNTVGVKTSSKNPVSHGLGLVMSIIKLVVEDRPIPFLGIPGVISLSSGVFFGIWLLMMYAQTHEITTNVALASIGFTLIGFFLISTAVTLYAITRIAQVTNKIQKNN